MTRWVKVRCECCQVEDAARVIEGAMYSQAVHNTNARIRCDRCRMDCPPQKQCKEATS